MVWSGNSFVYRTHRNFLRRYSMTTDLYLEELLDITMRLYRAVVDPDSIIIEDTTRPNSVIIVDYYTHGVPGVPSES